MSISLFGLGEGNMGHRKTATFCFSFVSPLGEVPSDTDDLNATHIADYFARVREAADVYENVITNPPRGMTRAEVLRVLQRVPSHRVTAAAEVPGRLDRLLSMHTQHLSSRSKPSLSEYPRTNEISSVGGHGGISVRADGLVLQKRTNATECVFYERVHKSGDSLGVVIPKSFSVEDVVALEVDLPSGKDSPARESELDGIRSEIFIENMVADFGDPFLLDIKIGESTASKSELRRHLGARDAWLKKKKSKIADVVSGSSLRGWRVVGRTGIQDGRGMTGINSINHLKEFITSACGTAVDIVRELHGVRAAVVESSYAFIASSVLIAVDRSLDVANRTPRVKLVDFAHAFTMADLGFDQFQKYRLQFLKGIDNLIAEIRAIDKIGRQDLLFIADTDSSSEWGDRYTRSDVAHLRRSQETGPVRTNSDWSIYSNPMEWDAEIEEYKLDTSVLDGDPDSLIEMAHATAHEMRSEFHRMTKSGGSDFFVRSVRDDEKNAILSIVYVSHIARILNGKVELGINGTVIKICP
ncbi:inositol polyphosphate kinase family protein [Streptomyces kaempferi]|uniref:Inositol polyphosphate kinase family protein n=1 Tax=Streptomyces kaempferi TaxID=333725 RepID=A0ABW3XWR9_9ACTN